MRNLTENEVVGAVLIFIVLVFAILMLSAGVLRYKMVKVEQERFHDSIMVILKIKGK